MQIFLKLLSFLQAPRSPFLFPCSHCLVQLAAATCQCLGDGHTRPVCPGNTVGERAHSTVEARGHPLGLDGSKKFSSHVPSSHQLSVPHECSTRVLEKLPGTRECPSQLSLVALLPNKPYHLQVGREVVQPQCKGKDTPPSFLGCPMCLPEGWSPRPLKGSVPVLRDAGLCPCHCSGPLAPMAQPDDAASTQASAPTPRLYLLASTCA